MITDWMLLLFAGLIGVSVGSFLNVCIYRLPIEQSLAYPPSRCMTCDRRLNWFENIPVLAWIVLGGKCRTCRTPIPAVYPLVEAFTGALFILATWHYGLGWLLFSRLLMGCALVVLFFIDLHHRILPNVITVPGTVVGFILSFVTPPGWVSSLVGLLLGGLIPLVLAETYLRVRKIEGLGMGDVKMLALIGAFLGWKLMLLTLALASFMGSFVGIGLIIARKGDMKFALPFGTFLAIAAIIAAAVGDQVIAWYVGLYW